MLPWALFVGILGGFGLAVVAGDAIFRAYVISPKDRDICSLRKDALAFSVMVMVGGIIVTTMCAGGLIFHFGSETGLVLKDTPSSDHIKMGIGPVTLVPNDEFTPEWLEKERARALRDLMEAKVGLEVALLEQEVADRELEAVRVGLGTAQGEREAADRELEAAVMSIRDKLEDSEPPLGPSWPGYTWIVVEQSCLVGVLAVVLAVVGFVTLPKWGTMEGKPLYSLYLIPTLIALLGVGEFLFAYSVAAQCMGWPGF